VKHQQSCGEGAGGVLAGGDGLEPSTSLEVRGPTLLPRYPESAVTCTFTTWWALLA